MKMNIPTNKFKIITILNKYSSNKNKLINNQKILLQLSVRSYNPLTFRELKSDLISITNFYNLNKKKINTTNYKINKITLLKSPHVYKRAREQFVSQLYQLQFVVYKSRNKNNKESFFYNESNILNYINTILMYIKPLSGFSIKLFLKI